MNIFKKLFGKISVDKKSTEQVYNIGYDVSETTEHQKFTIPISRKSKKEAGQSLKNLMNSYKEKISFDEDSGKLTVNENPYSPLKNEYWLYSHDNKESPKIEEFDDILSSLEHSILPQVVEHFTTSCRTR